MDLDCNNIFCNGNRERKCFWFDRPKNDCRDYRRDRIYEMSPEERQKSNASHEARRKTKGDV
jgi:hypothetical protein